MTADGHTATVEGPEAANERLPQRAHELREQVNRLARRQQRGQAVSVLPQRVQLLRAGGGDPHGHLAADVRVPGTTDEHRQQFQQTNGR